MKILIVATKAPWPPIDGGRLVLKNTIEALAGHGHDLSLIAPTSASRAEQAAIVGGLEAHCRVVLVNCRPRRHIPVLWKRILGGIPLTIARHDLRRVRRAVGRRLDEDDYDVVHVEQIQALAQAETALKSDIPVVLRQQNLEHLLWDCAARNRGTVARALFAREAERLKRWEETAMERVATTILLTREDTRRVLGIRSARTVEAPFPVELPAKPTQLEGQPAVSLLISARWQPNADLLRAFVDHWWPAILERAPRAVAHVFGDQPDARDRPGLRFHAPPVDSAEAFPKNAVVALTARHPTGVPMKGLEAWSRGLAVVASLEAAQSLDARDGREVLLASDPASFGDALKRLNDEPELYGRLVSNGRELLRQRHSPAIVARRLTEVYESAVAGRNRQT